MKKKCKHVIAGEVRGQERIIFFEVFDDCLYRWARIYGATDAEINAEEKKIRNSFYKHCPKCGEKLI